MFLLLPCCPALAAAPCLLLVPHSFPQPLTAPYVSPPPVSLPCLPPAPPLPCPTPTPPPPQLVRNAQRALFTGATIFLDLMLMLVVMTFNLGLIICVTLGYMLGALAFGEHSAAQHGIGDGHMGTPRHGMPLIIWGHAAEPAALSCRPAAFVHPVLPSTFDEPGLVPFARPAGHLKERVPAAAYAGGAKPAPTNPLFIVGSMQPPAEEAGFDPIQLDHQRSLRQIHTQA